ncbi:hypothetical protein M422DRAFT_782383 [Sphaerobolus stellatus SS14]|uniref:G domain-containing protein n=1 Tax=Sphaerobolus stellatus (strain SS14) TaxID=990650 RepID=A0A0C9U009_SPHS4|nr:hypothetical protein M422DRAFT_782383 [Sphaerobolus stellatus SS14]
MSNPDISHTANEGLRAEIHDITIKESKSKLTSVDFIIGQDVSKSQSAQKKDTLQITFNPPHEISDDSSFTLRLHYGYQVGVVKVPIKKHKDIIIDARSLLSEAELHDGEIHEWHRAYAEAKVTIVVRLRTASGGVRAPSPTDATELSPTTDRLTAICPRFRILVIGKSGVGKSSLINKVFGVEKASVSHLGPGQAEIEKELTSEQNKRLILHDSRGFEPGEVDTVQIAQTFIQRKVNALHIKDRLHAIWLCFEIPWAGGRLLETGVKDFLELKTSGKLGTIPVIAVFTKYDQLIDRAEFELHRQGIQGTSKEDIVERAKQELQEICIKPFETSVGDKVPYITVSTGEGYEQTVDDLVKLTFSSVEQHVASEPSITIAIAQKVSPRVKIDASISVGKAGYWKGLASGTNFVGKSLKSCLGVIHIDIVVVWAFDDPHGYLRSNEFRTLMYSLVNDLADPQPQKPNRTLTAGLSMVGTIAGIVSALAGPVAPIVVPIVAGAVLAMWLFQIYRQSDDTLRRLMAYIINLTLVMQNIFWLTTMTEGRPITRRLIKLAFKSYQESREKTQVHNDLYEYVKQAGLIERAGRDGVLEKIEQLINRNRIDSAEMHSLKDRISGIDLLAEDEPWDVENDSSVRT